MVYRLYIVYRLFLTQKTVSRNMMPKPMKNPWPWRIQRVRPFLTTVGSRQSKTRPFVTGLCCGWILLVLPISSRVDFFIVFALLLGVETVGVRQYCCIHCCLAVENRSPAPCFARSPRARRASRATKPRPTRLEALDLRRKPPKLRLWRCTG